MANVSCSLPQDMTCGLQFVWGQDGKKKGSRNKELEQAMEGSYVGSRQICLSWMEISNSKRWGLPREWENMNRGGHSPEGRAEKHQD